MASIYSSTNKGWRLRLDWSITGQSIADNKSTLSLDLWVYDGTGYSQTRAAAKRIIYFRAKNDGIRIITVPPDGTNWAARLLQSAIMQTARKVLR